MDFRDEVLFLALTVLQESAGEPYHGKLAVAFVIVGRGPSVIDNCFNPYQFSCWDTKSPTRLWLDAADDVVLKECYKAACAAYFGLVEDPSHGATHYLNVDACRRISGGGLPSWYDPARVTVVIGRHTFLRLA